MNCAHYSDSLVPYLEGLLAPEDARLIARHLNDCRNCPAELLALQAIHRRLILDGGALADETGVQRIMDDLLRKQIAPAHEPARMRLPRHSYRLTFTIAAGILAVILLSAIAGWFFISGRYPSPRISGSIRISSGGKAARGSILTSVGTGGTVILGNYCRLNLAPGAQITLEGADKAEQVFLRNGEVTCDISSNVGSFAVRTSLGTVHAVGTRFSVALVQLEGDENMLKKSSVAVAFVVAVIAGQVRVEFDGKTHALSAGEKRVFAAEEEAQGKIEAGKPIYSKKTGVAWAKEGRMVGVAKNAPAFTASALDKEGNIVKTSAPQAGADGTRVYELWLKPGVYTLRATAQGYAPLEITNLEVRAHYDLRIDLEFSKKSK